MRQVWLAATLLLGSQIGARGAEIAGVAMPDSENAGGAHLVLNGIALRTYSFLHLHVYVAALYLPTRTSDPNQILSSDQPRMLRFVFLRDVEAEQARKSWRESFDENCRAPCSLPPDGVARFLAGVPSVRKGDTSTLLFTAHALQITMNGQTLGTITDPVFARVILSVFVGQFPTTPEVKRGLLGLGG